MYILLTKNIPFYYYFEASKSHSITISKPPLDEDPRYF